MILIRYVSMKRLFPALLFCLVLLPDPVWATQTHGDPEGLTVHQVAHLFFAITMGLLVYWLRSRNLTVKNGWRFIQYAAVLLIFWNLDAFLVHTLDEASGLLEIQRVDNWHIRIAATQGSRALEVLYYLAKLDHLWCVPALVLLYAGLRRLAMDAGAAGQGAGES